MNIWIIAAVAFAACFGAAWATVLGFWLDWSDDTAKLHGIIERQRIENATLRKQLAQQGDERGK